MYEQKRSESKSQLPRFFAKILTKTKSVRITKTYKKENLKT